MSRLTLTLHVLPGKMPSLNESSRRPADAQHGSHELPSHDDAQRGSHELPSHDDAQHGSHELPSHDDAQHGSHELPSHDDAQCGSPELPSHDDAQCGSHELPSHDDAQHGSHELPSHDDAQCGSHELPSHDDAQHGSHELPSHDDAQCGSHEHGDVQHGKCKDVSNMPSHSWSWKCPAYDYHQNETCVSFVLHVMAVKERSLVTYVDMYTAHVTFMSACHPHGFSFFASFPENYKIESSSYKVDISPDNVVLTLKKCEDCIGFWDKMKVGTDSTHNTVRVVPPCLAIPDEQIVPQDRLFVTNSNLLHMNDSSDPWVSDEVYV